METFSTLLTLCDWNPPVTGGFPWQRPVMWNFDIFFDLCLNKKLNKQSIQRWFESYHDYDITVMHYSYSLLYNSCKYEFLELITIGLTNV